MSTTISFTVIHKECKKTMRIEGKVWWKVWVCIKCWERKLIDNRTVEIINWIMMV